MDNSKEIQQELLQSQYRVGGIPYHTHNGTDSPNIIYKNISYAPNTFCVATTTTGTTAVPIFGTNGATFPLTITGVFLTALDTTAGTISVLNNGTTVTTVGKGTVAGAMLGATSLSHTAYTAGQTITVVSSTGGNATVFMTYTI